MWYVLNSGLNFILQSAFRESGCVFQSWLALSKQDVKEVIGLFLWFFLWLMRVMTPYIPEDHQSFNKDASARGSLPFPRKCQLKTGSGRNNIKPIPAAVKHTSLSEFRSFDFHLISSQVVNFKVKSTKNNFHSFDFHLISSLVVNFKVKNTKIT